MHSFRIEGRVDGGRKSLSSLLTIDRKQTTALSITDDGEDLPRRKGYPVDLGRVPDARVHAALRDPMTA